MQKNQLYLLGVKNHEALLEARKKIAHILFTQPDSVMFTSGGTEANNLAIFGLMKNEFGLAEIKKNHIITTTIEHHSVLKPIQELEKQGAEVAYIPVNKSGEISVADIVAAIKPNTKLISIMYANNEIGSINPIAEIGRAILKYRQKNTPRPPTSLRALDKQLNSLIFTLMRAKPREHWICISNVYMLI